MTDAELSAYQAAAYRVLTACEYSIEEAYRVDGPSITVPQALLDDARKVIERWNADHPADDDDPVTQEWVAGNWPDTLNALLFLVWDDVCVQAWTVNTHDTIRNMVTRGDVRAFLRGMGRKTNESVATGTLQGSGSDREELFGRRQYPGCSCHACGGISPAGDPPGTWFNACPLCQHKRCPHCEDHRYECTGSNAPGQVGTLSTKGGDA